MSTEIKQMSDHGVEFLVNEEGLVLHPYLDKNKIPTIGVGNTYYPDNTRVKMTDPPLKKEEAIFLFKTVLKTYEKDVWSLTRDDINQNQFDALVSLCYNIGTSRFRTSTALRRVNADPKDPNIAQAFMMWKKPDLLQRRIREAHLYFS